MNCVFCCSPKIIRFEIRNKVYGYCSSCGGYFLDNRFFLSPKEQKERYLLHDNSLENQGYRQFLKKFLDFSLPFIKEKDVIAFKMKDGTLVTHRAIEINDSGIVTKGDNNKDADNNIVTKGNFVGKNLFWIPNRCFFRYSEE